MKERRIFNPIRLIACLAGVLLALMNMTAFAQLAAPSAPSLSAKGYLLIDANSGQVLASKQADVRLDPASITKLMTAYAVFRAIRSGQINLDDMAVISEKAWRTPGSRMFIEIGSRVPVSQLLPGMIIQSGNDASVALAEHVAGSEQSFAEVMNQLAAELGMTQTNYRNSTGLSEENHYTSATDIGKLAVALIEEFPDYYKWYSQKEFTYNNITQGNRNALLWRDDSVDGLKTGYTESAGYCLVASAKRDGMRLISVVLGTASPAARANESQSLLNYGFRFFETALLWDSGQVLATERVWKGTEESTDLIITAPVYVTYPRGALDQLTTTVAIRDKLMAPLSTTRAVGKAIATVNGETFAEANLYSAREIPAGGLLQSTWDEVLLWFE